MKAYSEFKDHFAVGKPVNFYSMGSWSRDESMIDNFLALSSPLIVLKCNNLKAYKIENISMIKRLFGENEGEVLVEPPSYFKVISTPIKIKNHIIIDITYDEELSKKMSYLVSSSPTMDDVLRENELLKKKMNDVIKTNSILEAKVHELSREIEKLKVSGIASIITAEPVRKVPETKEPEKRVPETKEPENREPEKTEPEESSRFIQNFRTPPMDLTPQDVPWAILDFVCDCCGIQYLYKDLNMHESSYFHDDKPYYTKNTTLGSNHWRKDGGPIEEFTFDDQIECAFCAKKFKFFND